MEQNQIQIAAQQETKLTSRISDEIREHALEEVTSLVKLTTKITTA